MLSFKQLPDYSATKFLDLKHSDSNLQISDSIFSFNFYFHKFCLYIIRKLFFKKKVDTIMLLFKEQDNKYLTPGDEMSWDFSSTMIYILFVTSKQLEFTYRGRMEWILCNWLSSCIWKWLSLWEKMVCVNLQMVKSIL